MEPQRIAVRLLESDEMASYGMHPELHEDLVRCHNPALYGQPEPAGRSVAETQRRIGEAVRQAPAERDSSNGLVLSA